MASVLSTARNTFWVNANVWRIRVKKPTGQPAEAAGSTSYSASVARRCYRTARPADKPTRKQASPKRVEVIAFKGAVRSPEDRPSAFDPLAAAAAEPDNAGGEQGAELAAPTEDDGDEDVSVLSSLEADVLATVDRLDGGDDATADDEGEEEPGAFDSGAATPGAAVATGEPAAAAQDESGALKQKLQRLRSIRTRLQKNASENQVATRQYQELVSRQHRAKDRLHNLHQQRLRLADELKNDPPSRPDELAALQRNLEAKEQACLVAGIAAEALSDEVRRAHHALLAIGRERHRLRALNQPFNKTWATAARKVSSIAKFERCGAPSWTRLPIPERLRRLLHHMHKLGKMPSGEVEFVEADGQVIFPDGTRVSPSDFPKAPDGAGVCPSGTGASLALWALLARMRQEMESEIRQALADGNFFEAQSVLFNSQPYGDAVHWQLLISYAVDHDMHEELLAIIEAFLRETSFPLEHRVFMRAIEMSAARELWPETLRTMFWFRVFSDQRETDDCARVTKALEHGDRYASLLRFLEAHVRRGSHHEYGIAVSFVRVGDPKAFQEYFRSGAIVAALGQQKREWLELTKEERAARRQEHDAYVQRIRQTRSRFLQYIWSSSFYRGAAEFALLAPRIKPHSIDAEVAVADASFSHRQGSVAVAFVESARRTDASPEPTTAADASPGPTTAGVVHLPIGQASSAMHAELAGVHAALLMSNPRTLREVYCDNMPVCDVVTKLGLRMRRDKMVDTRELVLGPLFYETAKLFANSRLSEVSHVKGHTAQLDLPSRLNRVADRYAYYGRRKATESGVPIPVDMSIEDAVVSRGAPPP